MALHPPENPRNSPISSPSDTLLKNFRATLEARWEEFDKATLQEAEKEKGAHPLGGLLDFGAAIGLSDDLKTKRNKDPKFLSAKATFDETKALLASINSDEELRKNAAVLAKVESTLQSITKYLAEEVKPEERNKSHNIILAKTKADLADFRAKLTGKPEDAREAVMAAEAERSIPRPAVMAAAAGAATIPFISSAQAGELAKEGVKEGKKGIRAWIAGAMGIDKATLIEDMGKKARGEEIGVIKTLKIWLVSLLTNIPFLDMTEDWTEEEKKKAGLIPKATTPVAGNEKPQGQVERIGDDISFKAGYKGFVRMYYSTLEGVKGDIKASDIDNAFQYAPFLSMKYSEAESLYRKHNSNPSGLLSEPQMKGITDKDSAFAALTLLVSGSSSEFLKKRYPGGIGNMSIKDIITGIKDSFDIAENIENIEIKSMEDITGFMGKIGEKMDISIKDGKISQDALKTKAEQLGMNQGKLLAFTLVESANTPISKYSTNESVDQLSSLDPEGKKKLKEILELGKNIVPVLIKNCSFGQPEKYREKFNGISPDLSDITKMYITLGGKTDFSSMSQAGHLYCYQKTWQFLSIDPSFRGEFFDQPMMQAIMDDSKDILPPETKDMLKRLMARSATQFLEKMKGTAKEIYGAMKWHHIAAVSAIVAGYLIWGKRFAWIGYGAAVAMLAKIVSDVLASISSKESDGKYKLPSGTKVTPEEGAQAIISEMERIGTK